MGGGLNDNRKKLIDLFNDKTVDVIIVEHKDRLTRFGFNYIKTLLAMQNRKIEVVNQVIGEREYLIADFTSIITSFCARIYGQRRTKRKNEQLIKELQDK